MPMASPITGLVILAEANSSSWSRWEERRRNDLEMRQNSRMESFQNCTLQSFLSEGTWKVMIERM